MTRSVSNSDCPTGWRREALSVRRYTAAVTLAVWLSTFLGMGGVGGMPVGTFVAVACRMAPARANVERAREAGKRLGGAVALR